MVLALKLVLLTISSLSYNNNDIMLKRQTLLSPRSAIWLCWGRITPSKSTLLPGLKRRIHLGFSSCCLSEKGFSPTRLKPQRLAVMGGTAGMVQKPHRRAEGRARGATAPNPCLAVHLDKQGLSRPPPPASECQKPVTVCLEVTRERWLDSCLEPRLVF